MLKKNIFLCLITISLIGNFLYTFKSKIILDCFFQKLISCNRHQYPNKELSAWNFSNKYIHINEYIQKLELTKSRDFFAETSFYLKNLAKLTNHGPIFSILTRLPIIRSLGIWGFRLLNFIFFILALLIFNGLMKELFFSENARYLTLLISTLSIHGQTIIQHGRIYASGFSFNLLACFLLIKVIKSNNRKKLYALLLFFSIHLCFLNYYFFAIYLPVIFFGFLIYFYFQHKELGIQKKHIYYLAGYLIFCLASLLIYKNLAYSSIDQSVDTWISNNGHFDLNYYIKNIIENYLSLLSNHLKTPWNIILSFTLIASGLLYGDKKKIVPFYIIFFGISILMLVLDYYFQTRTSTIIRYSYACLPAVFIIYGLSFSNQNDASSSEARFEVFASIRNKFNYIFLTVFFLLPIVFPQFKNWKNLHYIQNEAINLAQASSQFHFDRKKVLIISHMMEIDTLTFCKYLVEELDKQPAIFNQKTQREIYITTQPKLEIKEILNFIKEKNIKLVIFLDHSFIVKGNPESETYHQLKSENLGILQKELSKLSGIEFNIIKNLDK